MKWINIVAISLSIVPCDQISFVFSIFICSRLATFAYHSSLVFASCHWPFRNKKYARDGIYEFGIYILFLHWNRFMQLKYHSFVHALRSLFFHHSRSMAHPFRINEIIRNDVDIFMVHKTLILHYRSFFVARQSLPYSCIHYQSFYFVPSTISLQYILY